MSEFLPYRDPMGAEALAVLSPPHHTQNHAHKGTHNPPTILFVVSQSHMVLISAHTYGCTLSSVLGGECIRVGFPPLGYPPTALNPRTIQDPDTHNILLGTTTTFAPVRHPYSADMANLLVRTFKYRLGKHLDKLQQERTQGPE